MELNALELTVLSLLLAGDDPVLALLRAQSEAATIASREMTGVGFYTNFVVPESVDRTVPQNFVLDDVFGTFTGSDTDAGFLLFVRNGVVSCLEGFTYGDEGWPTEPRLIEAYYMHHVPPDSGALSRCAVRDLKQLRDSWGRKP
jgi:hypothetical protein